MGCIEMSGLPLLGYHAHVYFDLAQYDTAKALCETVRDRFGIKMGRLHKVRIGPHPTGSCQLSVPLDGFGDIIPYLMQARGELTVFLHGYSGNDYIDHTQHVMWLGKSHTLDLSVFTKGTPVSSRCMAYNDDQAVPPHTD